MKYSSLEYREFDIRLSGKEQIEFVFEPQDLPLETEIKERLIQEGWNNVCKNYPGLVASMRESKVLINFRSVEHNKDKITIHYNFNTHYKEIISLRNISDFSQLEHHYLALPKALCTVAITKTKDNHTILWLRSGGDWEENKYEIPGGFMRKEEGLDPLESVQNRLRDDGILFEGILFKMVAIYEMMASLEVHFVFTAILPLTLAELEVWASQHGNQFKTYEDLDLLELHKPNLPYEWLLRE